MARPAQLCEEEPLAAEERVLDAPDELDVVVDALRHGHEAACIHPQGFAHAEFALDGGSTRMDIDLPIAFELLHDEALTTEEPGSHALLELDADAHPLRRAEEAVLL